MSQHPLALRLVLLIPTLLFANTLAPAGQMPTPVGQAPTPPGTPNSGHAEPDKDPALARMQEQVAKGRNEDRQKRLVEDTAHLYELAAQLKEEVGKTDQHTLSLDVIKKAEQIEKLAKNVKDRMRG